MPKVSTFQASFNAGVMDVATSARVDVEQYYRALSLGQNIEILPQGGFRRRAGWGYVQTLPGKTRFKPFTFNTEQTYLIGFSDLEIRVWKDDALLATVVSPYTEAQLRELDVAQSADTMIITHESHAPRKLVRGATETSWTLDIATLNNIPQYNFDDADSPASTAHEQRLTFAGSWQNGDMFTLTVNGRTTAAIPWNDDETLFEAFIKSALETLLRNATLGISGSIDVDASSYPTVDITLGGGYQGVQDNFATTVTVGSGTITPTVIVSGTGGVGEDVWSATRGWPRTVVFYGGRLWFGGSPQKPTTLWGSVTNDPFNFDLGESFDDEAIFWNMDTERLNAITALVSGRHLQIFTAGGEFYVPDKAITPTNMATPKQSDHGSKRITPAVIDGGTIFVERSGAVVREFLYEFVEDAFSSPPISSLASSLIRNPLEMSVRRSVSSNDADYVNFVNEDGTVTVLAMLRAQNIAAFSEWTTDGSVYSTAVLTNESDLLGIQHQQDLYLCVERELNGATVYTMEKADAGRFLDCSVIGAVGSPATIVSGAGHLVGEEVRVRDATHSIYATQTVTPAGTVTLTTPAQDVEMGLWFKPRADTMDLNPQFGSGPRIYRRKRPVRVIARIEDTLGLIIDGHLVPDRFFGYPLDTPVAPRSGIAEIYLSGYSRRRSISFTQDNPLPMTVLAADIEMRAA